MEILLGKLKSWIPSNIAGILGIAQAILKFIKEVCTLFLNIIAPLIPGDNDTKIVTLVRNLCNQLDNLIEKLKNWLLTI